MSSVANASIEAIERLRERNIDFYGLVSTYKNEFTIAINGLREQCNSKLIAYKTMLAEAESLLAKARAKQSAAKAQVASSQARVNSTPATVTKTKTDSEGKTTTQQVANPAHAAAQSDLNNARQRAQAADDMVAQVLKMRDYLSGRHSEIQGIGASIGNLNNDISSVIERTSSLSESVTHRLEATVRAIKDYLDYGIR